MNQRYLSVPEVYAIFLLRITDADISDRNLSILLEAAGKDVSLHNAEKFITFFDDDVFETVAQKIIESDQQNMISNKQNNIEGGNLGAIIVLLLLHTADRRVTETSLIETVQAAGLHSWVKTVNFSPLVEEYKYGDLRQLIEKINNEVSNSLQTFENIDTGKAKSVDRNVDGTHDKTNTKNMDEKEKKDVESNSKKTNNKNTKKRNKERNIIKNKKKVMKMVKEMKQEMDVKTKDSNGDNRSNRYKKDSKSSKHEKKKQQKDIADSTTLSALQDVDPYEFEKLVACVWEKQDYETEVTGGSNDRGIDIIAKREQPISERILIQAKRHGSTSKITSGDVQKYSGLYQRDEQVDSVVIVTSNEFTDEATKVADTRGVKTVSGEELLNQIRSLNLEGDVSSQDEVTRRTERGNQNSTREIPDKPMTCPFCGYKLQRKTSAYADHLVDDCEIDSIEEIPSQRPTNIPPEIWLELKDQFDISTKYEQISSKTSKESGPETNKESGSEAKPNSNYRYVPPGFWEKYIFVIIVFLSLFIILSILAVLT